MKSRTYTGIVSSDNGRCVLFVDGKALTFEDMAVTPFFDRRVRVTIGLAPAKKEPTHV
jgi:hypothetical protein